MAPLLAIGLVARGEDTADSDDGAVALDPATSAGGTAGETLAAAGATATAQVQGTVFSVDRRDAGDWEVSVVGDDGTEHDLTVSAHGRPWSGAPRRTWTTRLATVRSGSGCSR